MQLSNIHHSSYSTATLILDLVSELNDCLQLAVIVKLDAE